MAISTDLIWIVGFEPGSTWACPERFERCFVLLAKLKLKVFKRFQVFGTNMCPIIRYFRTTMIFELIVNRCLYYLVNISIFTSTKQVHLILYLV